MKKDFEAVKSIVLIEDIARYLLGDSVRGMYRYPGEKTPSIKIYAGTQSFYDFGRATGGDCIKLWSRVRQCDSWTALKAIRNLYGLSDEPDRENIKERIRQQERAREAAKQAENKRKADWRSEVDFWKKILESCNAIIRRSAEFSDEWTYCMNLRQIVDYRLDYLCGIFE